MIALNPLGFIAQLIAGYRIAKGLQAWLRLAAGMALSAIIAFLGTTGLSLLNGATWPYAIGAGMVATAVALLSLFTASPLTRGMAISIPQNVVRRLHEEQDQTTIHRS